MHTITLYSKDGCHLCEQVMLELRPFVDELGLHVQEVNITTDPVLWQRFRYLIPVIATPTRAFFAPIDMDELMEVLRDVNTWPAC